MVGRGAGMVEWEVWEVKLGMGKFSVWELGMGCVG